MTPAESASETPRTLFCGIDLKKVGKNTRAPPRPVAKPAPMDTMMA